MKNLKTESEVARLSQGENYFGPTKTEKKFLKFRRSIYIFKDIKKNEKFSKKNLKIIRPGLGLHPKFYENIIGKKAARNIKQGVPLIKKYIK